MICICISAKKFPNNNKDSFFTDEELKENKKAIDAAFRIINKKIKEGFSIALPEDGLGTGLSRLPEKAPLTFVYLEEKLNKLKKRFRKA